MSGWFWPGAIHDHGADSLSQNYDACSPPPQLFDGLLSAEMCTVETFILTDITMKFATVP